MTIRALVRPAMAVEKVEWHTFAALPRAGDIIYVSESEGSRLKVIEMAWVRLPEGDDEVFHPRLTVMPLGR